MQEENNVKVVKTDTNNINGQDKCPKCGATDISPAKNGKLRCNFCRHEFEPEKLSGTVEDIKQLKGKVVTTGVSDIKADAKDVITLKCSSCGAEVVIDTASAMQARCHWCRNTLSINEQIPNGSVPDIVLPFAIPKEDARVEIEGFVGKRKFFAHPTFRKEFTTENIMGVYFPYMIIDTNAHATFIGEGEHQTRSYTVGNSDNRRTYYDADLYHVERDFDIIVNGLSIESNKDRLDTNNKEKTNNIINSIMPFDIENSVKYNANYLKGYTSEKRDTNVSELQDVVNAQTKDIARYAANEYLKHYDRGVKWDKEDLKIHGQQWKAAYLPVWLYSYQQVKGDKKLLHYVAVNARTKETMGSVPINMTKLLLLSLVVEILSFFAMINVDWDYNYLFLSFGIIYFLVIYGRYRNSSARHTYEADTKKEVSNMKQVDKFIQKRTGLSNSRMQGANNTALNGTTNGKGFLGNSLKDSVVSSAISGGTVVNLIKNNINKK